MSDNDERKIDPYRVYNIEEASKVLGMNPQTLSDYLRDGRIEAQKIGEWKILGKNLIDFLSVKTYVIVTKQGVKGTVKAMNQEELYKKLSTGAYGVVSRNSKTAIQYTPENIKEIVELKD